MTNPPAPPHRPGLQGRSARIRGSRGPLRPRPGGSPHAAADALVVEHLPFAAKVAANYARRTGHPREDLEQQAAIGLIKASRRYDRFHLGRRCAGAGSRAGSGSSHFIAYARPYVNGEITHYLRDKGFLISLPGRWRELHARGEKLRREGIGAAVIAARLGISLGRWSEICDACRVRVVAMPLGEAEEESDG